MPTDVQQEDPFGIHSAIDQKHSNGAITAGHFNVAMGSGKCVNDLPMKMKTFIYHGISHCHVVSLPIYIYLSITN
jgi:hypothetical protein